MNILVTGSTGFIGGRLCEALVEAGHKVRAFHRASSSLRLLEKLEVEHAIGDLTRPETLAEAMQGIEVVFHAAAFLGTREDPGRQYAVTVEGTRSMLAAAQKAGVRRFIHTSSVAALGVPEDPTPGQNALMDESHTWNYRSDYWPYGYAKYLAELEVQKAVAGGLDAVILNPALVFGRGDVYRQSSSLVVSVARQRLPGMVAGGVNAVHISDVVAGHLAAMERGRKGERYILGGMNVSIAWLIREIARIAGVQPPSLTIPTGLARALAGPLHLLQPFITAPVALDQLRMAGLYFYFDTRKARVELGLPPPHAVEEALQEAYDWFVDAGAISKPVKKLEKKENGEKNETEPEVPAAERDTST